MINGYTNSYQLPIGQGDRMAAPGAAGSTAPSAPGSDAWDIAVGGREGPSRQYVPRMRVAGLSSAVDVLRHLAPSTTEAQLHDAMLELALDYGHSPDAYLLVCEHGRYRLAGHASVGPVAAPLTTLPNATALAVTQLSAGAAPVWVDYGGRTCTAVAITADGAVLLGALCLVAQHSLPAEALRVLTWIAACGALQLDKLRTTARLAHQNEALRCELSDRISLSGHLNDERGLLRTLIDNMPDHIYVKDRSGRFVIGNKAAAEGIGNYTPQELVGKSDLDLYPLECGQRFFMDEQKIIQSGQPLIDQLEENVNQNGVRRWFSTTKMPFHDAAGEPIGIVGISRDVTQRVDADEAIRLRNRAIELSQDGIMIVSCLSADTPVLYVNPAFERITGFTLEDAQQRGVAMLLGDVVDPSAGNALRDAMDVQQEGRAVLRSVRKDGVEFWNEVRLAIVRDIAGNASHFVFTMSDISSARHAEEQLELLASHDALTGLPNRRMLMDRLTQAIALSERGTFLLAVAFIDLDRLKFVNDTYGHEAGDHMLHTVAERMAGCVRKADTVARLGGDEFVLVSLHEVGGPFESGLQDVTEMLGKIQALLGEAILLGEVPFHVTCSIGVSVYPRDGHDAESLLKHADAAMYTAKNLGRDRIEFYSQAPQPD